MNTRFFQVELAFKKMMRLKAHLLLPELILWRYFFSRNSEPIFTFKNGSLLALFSLSKIVLSLSGELLRKFYRSEPVIYS